MAVAIPQQTPAPPLALPRRAVWTLWGGLAAGAALGGAGALTYLWPRRAFGLGDAGAAGEYVVGTVRYFPGIGGGADLARHSGYYVVRRPDGFVAFATICTHQVASRCRLARHESVQPQGTVGQFSCPCHARTRWSLRRRQVPATRPASAAGPLAKIAVSPPTLKPCCHEWLFTAAAEAAACSACRASAAAASRRARRHRVRRTPGRRSWRTDTPGRSAPAFPRT